MEEEVEEEEEEELFVGQEDELGYGLYFEKPHRRPKVNRTKQRLPWAKGVSTKAVSLFKSLCEKIVKEDEDDKKSPQLSQTAVHQTLDRITQNLGQQDEQITITQQVDDVNEKTVEAKTSEIEAVVEVGDVEMRTDETEKNEEKTAETEIIQDGEQEQNATQTLCTAMDIENNEKKETNAEIRTGCEKTQEKKRKRDSEQPPSTETNNTNAKINKKKRIENIKEKDKTDNNNQQLQMRVWNGEVGMGVWERCWVCLQTWLKVSAHEEHPAVGREENLKELLSDPYSPSPLSLYLYTLISHGAYVLDDAELEAECIGRSREMLGSLFDSPDYTTATVLVLMSAQALRKDGNKQKGSYYATLAETMCCHLGCTNSDTYMRALAFSLVSRLNNTLKDIHTFHLKVQEAQERPFHFVMSERDLHFLTEGNSFDNNYNNIDSNNNNNNDLQRQYVLPPYHRKAFYTVTIALSLIRTPDEIAPSLLEELMKRLGRMYKEWDEVVSKTKQQQKQQDKGKQQTQKEKEADEEGAYSWNIKEGRMVLTRVLFLSVLVEGWRRIGCHSKAYRWASLYLTVAHHPYYLYLSTCAYTAVSVLAVFAESESSYWQLQLLVDILRKIKHKHFGVPAILKKYEILLATEADQLPDTLPPQYPSQIN